MLTQAREKRQIGQRYWLKSLQSRFLPECRMLFGCFNFSGA